MRVLLDRDDFYWGLFVCLFLGSSDFIRCPEAGVGRVLPVLRSDSEERGRLGRLRAPSGRPRISPADPSPLPLRFGSSGLITW